MINKNILQKKYWMLWYLGKMTRNPFFDYLKVVSKCDSHHNKYVPLAMQIWLIAKHRLLASIFAVTVNKIWCTKINGGELWKDQLKMFHNFITIFRLFEGGIKVWFWSQYVPLAMQIWLIAKRYRLLGFHSSCYCKENLVYLPPTTPYLATSLSFL